VELSILEVSMCMKAQISPIEITGIVALEVVAQAARCEALAVPTRPTPKHLPFKYRSPNMGRLGAPTDLTSYAEKLKAQQHLCHSPAHRHSRVVSMQLLGAGSLLVGVRDGQQPELRSSALCSPRSPNKPRECPGKCRQFNGFCFVEAGSGPGGRWFKSTRPDHFQMVQQLPR